MLLRHPLRRWFGRLGAVPLAAVLLAGCDVQLHHGAASVSRPRQVVGRQLARLRGDIARVVAASVTLPGSGAADVVSADQDGAQLREQILRKYRVGLLKGGVVLIPREKTAGVSSIEVTDGTVAIDGSPATGREIRARLGADAEPILQLSYMTPDARQRLLQEEAAEPRTASPEPSPGAEPGVLPPPEEPPSPPAEPRWPEIERTHSDARIRVGGDIHVGEHEVVNGPVVALGGQVTIDGTVRDNVVAVGGSVHLGPHADVTGDVTAVGGNIVREPGARIGGHQNEVGFGFPRFRIRPLWGWPGGAWWLWRPEGPWRLAMSVFRMLFFAVVTLLVVLVAHRPVERVADAVALEPWKAGLVGLLAELFVLPAIILAVIVLAVSIIGIPLLLIVPPLIILALVVAFVLGFAGVGLGIGRWLAGHFRWPVAVPFGAVLAGLLAVWLLTLAGRVVGLLGWPLWIVSAALLTAGFLVEYVAWTVGLGAALLTRFGNRPVGMVAPAPATIPPPAGPSDQP